MQQKKEYKSATVRAQTESWKEFCCIQDKEGLWKGIYRVRGRIASRVENPPLVRDGDVLDAVQSGYPIPRGPSSRR